MRKRASAGERSKEARPGVHRRERARAAAVKGGKAALRHTSVVTHAGAAQHLQQLLSLTRLLRDRSWQR